MEISYDPDHNHPVNSYILTYPTSLKALSDIAYKLFYVKSYNWITGLYSQLVYACQDI